MATRFVNGHTVTGEAVDLVADGGVFTTTGDTGDTDTIDLGGRLILPSFGEPHAHLDKSMLADRFPNPGGDLIGAIEVMRAGWATIDEQDVFDRAIAAVKRLVASGTTLIRTHSDSHHYAGLKSVRSLLAARTAVEPICDMEVVALAYPLTGPDGSEGRRILDEAIELGVDLIGGAPHLEEDPVAATEHILRLAVETRLHVDLHVDEILDPEYDTLMSLSKEVIRHGLEGTVTASHCVSHGLKSAEEQSIIAAAVADAGINVIALPRTNLYLLARGNVQAPPRGTLGVETMNRAGVVVGAGADNCQDPFNAMGRCDPLDTASLMVSVCHRTPEEAFEAVTGAVRKIANRPAITFEPGSPADFVAMQADSIRTAIADQSPDRIVVHRGQVVARTTVETWIA